MNTGNAFKRREWIMLIILLGIIEFLIFYLSYLYDDNGNILNFISLAGTVVSILLALLAIIYSYYQNFIQQMSSSTISSQLTTLHDVSTNIKQNTNNLSTVIEKFEELETKMNDTFVNISELNNKSDMINMKIDNMLFKPSITEEDSPKEDSPISERIEYLVNAANLVLYISFMWLYVNDGKEISFVDIVNDLNKLIDRVTESDYTYKQAFCGACSAALISLDSFGLLKGSFKAKSNFELNKDFKEKIYNTFFSKDFSETDSNIVNIVNEIKSLS